MTSISKKIKACHSWVFDNIEYANIHTYITYIYAERKALATFCIIRMLGVQKYYQLQIQKDKHRNTNTKTIGNFGIRWCSARRIWESRAASAAPPSPHHHPKAPLLTRIWEHSVLHIWENPTHVRVFHIFIYEHFVHIWPCYNYRVFFKRFPQNSTQKLIGR